MYTDKEAALSVRKEIKFHHRMNPIKRYVIKLTHKIAITKAKLSSISLQNFK